jgi:hypothetical protein
MQIKLNSLYSYKEDAFDNGLQFHNSGGSITPSGPHFFSEQDLNDSYSGETQRNILYYF